MCVQADQLTSSLVHSKRPVNAAARTTRIDYKLKWKLKKRVGGFPRITIVYSNFYFLRVIIARWIMTSSTTEIPSAGRIGHAKSSMSLSSKRVEGGWADTEWCTSRFRNYSIRYKMCLWFATAGTLHICQIVGQFRGHKKHHPLRRQNTLSY